MTDNIKKTDSLKIAIIINIVIIILVCLLFSVESRGEYRLMLVPLLWMSFMILVILGICFSVKSGKKLTTLGIILRIIIVLFVFSPLIGRLIDELIDMFKNL